MGNSPATLVTIQRFNKLEEAHIAKGLLESCGVQAFLSDENMININAFYSIALGGVGLSVKEGDADLAKQILLSSSSDDAVAQSPSNDDSKTLSFSSPMVSAFNEIRSKPLFWLIIGVINIFLFSATALLWVSLEMQHRGPSIWHLLYFFSLVAYCFFISAVTRFCLAVIDGKPFTAQNIKIAPYALVQYFCGTIVYSLLYSWGLKLFVIPGVIFGINFIFWSYIFWDKNSTIWEAFILSWRLTKQTRFLLFIFCGTLVCLNVVAAIYLLVGLVFTAPMSWLATAFMYRQALAKNSYVEL